jgi:hypothetical protein
MASKTVWIVGGVVVAIGAIAYLSYNKAPAGKDAAGTIVEAKRALSDGASGPATSSGPSGDRSTDSDAKSQDAKSQDAKSQDAKSQDAKSQDAKSQDAKSQDAKSQDAKAQDAKAQ